jgi:hypothetical protein
MAASKPPPASWRIASGDGKIAEPADSRRLDMGDTAARVFTLGPLARLAPGDLEVQKLV